MVLIIHGLVIVNIINLIKGHKVEGLDERYVVESEDEFWHLKSPTERDYATTVLATFKKHKSLTFGIEFVDNNVTIEDSDNSFTIDFYNEHGAKKTVTFTIHENLTMTAYGNAFMEHGNLANNPLRFELTATELRAENDKVIQKFPNDFLEFNGYYALPLKLTWEEKSRNFGFYIPKSYVLQPHIYSSKTKSATAAGGGNKTVHTAMACFQPTFIHSTGFIVMMVILGIILLIILMGLFYLCYLKLINRNDKKEYQQLPDESLTTYSLNERKDKPSEISENQESTATTKEGKTPMPLPSQKQHTVVYSRKDSPTEYINLCRNKVDESTTTSKQTPAKPQNNDRFYTAKEFVPINKTPKNKETGNVEPTQKSDDVKTANKFKESQKGKQTPVLESQKGEGTPVPESQTAIGTPNLQSQKNKGKSIPQKYKENTVTQQTNKETIMTSSNNGKETTHSDENMMKTNAELTPVSSSK